MKRTPYLILVITLMSVLVGLYCWDVFANGTPYTENLSRFALLEAGLAITLIRVATGAKKGRVPLSVLEREYAAFLSESFADTPKNRKKLLEAARFYNENKYEKAMDLLFSLQRECVSTLDRIGVLMLMALCLDDMGLYAEAATTYSDLLPMLTNDEVKSTVYNNLGLLYCKHGDYEKAAECYEAALHDDPDNAYARNNIAKIYYEMGEYDKAVREAEKALELHPKLYQAASLLCMIHAIEGRDGESEKYFRRAVAAGESSAALKATLTRLTGKE